MAICTAINNRRAFVGIVSELNGQTHSGNLKGQLSILHFITDVHFSFFQGGCSKSRGPVETCAHAVTPPCTQPALHVLNQSK